LVLTGGGGDDILEDVFSEETTINQLSSGTVTPEMSACQEPTMVQPDLFSSSMDVAR